MLRGVKTAPAERAYAESSPFAPVSQALPSARIILRSHSVTLGLGRGDTAHRQSEATFDVSTARASVMAASTAPVHCDPDILGVWRGAN